MSGTPFMQLYIADYLGDTQHLTTEQHGAYLLLLMAMWRAGGRLPYDPGKLARIARVNSRRWHLLAAELMSFFDVEGDEITQKRLVHERIKAASISEKRSASGKLGGNAKALKRNNTPLANAKQMPQHSQIPDIRKEANASSADVLANAQTTARRTPKKSEPIAEPQPAEIQSADYPAWHGSAEERFWAMHRDMQAVGVSKGMMGKLANLCAGDFDEATSILMSTAKAKEPRRYLGKITSDLARAQEPPPPPDPNVPAWVTGARAEGYPVEREGKYWRFAGGLFDDEKQQVGN